MRSRLRRLAGSRLLDELDPSGQRHADLAAGEPTISTYHAYAGRLVAEHGLRIGVEPGARLLSEAAAWQYAHRVVEAWPGQMTGFEPAVSSLVRALVQASSALAEHLVSPEQAADLLHEGLTEMRGTTAPRLLLELVCARVLLPAASYDESAVLSRLERLERRLDIAGPAAGGAVPVVPPSVPGPTHAEHPAERPVAQSSHRCNWLHFCRLGFAPRPARAR